MTAGRRETWAPARQAGFQGDRCISCCLLVGCVSVLLLTAAAEPRSPFILLGSERVVWHHKGTRRSRHQRFFSLVVRAQRERRARASSAGLLRKTLPSQRRRAARAATRAMSHSSPAATVPPSSAPVLQVKNLSFRHDADGERQVSKVSFSVQAGRTFGILGGNECGKTSLAHVVLGSLCPESGSVEIFGEDVTARPPKPQRWLLAVRVGIVACIVLMGALHVLHSSLLHMLMRNGAWSIPCLLLLLELASRVHARWSNAGGPRADATETGRAPAGMLARGVAYISSEHDGGQKLPEDATVEEVIGRDMPLPKGAKDARRREVCAALKAAGFQLMAESGTPVGTAEDYLENGLKCGELSGGQRHLVYLLSVLAARPRLLICDDVLCGLDIDRQSSFVTLLSKLQLRFGMAILYMTVDLTPFTLVAHEGAFMRHGKFLEQGSAQDLVETPQRRDTQEYVRLSMENEERSHGKNLRMAYRKGESVFSL